MNKKLLNQPVRIGEVYRNGENLYRVEHFKDECIRNRVHLQRIKDGWELDAEGAALYATDRGVELLWDWSKNGHWGNKAS